LDPDWDHLEWDQEYVVASRSRSIEYLFDDSQSIVSENNSPDIPFRYSLNPYRGCVHGCAYCYARPYHEFLGMNAGLDFETKIVVKRDAAKLFRDFLARAKYLPEPISFSGITDCYQPAEREFRLTRQCLEVAAECRQPVSIITKNALVIRDLDLMQELARDNLIHVFVSITTLLPELARTMEPRTSIPAARLRAIKILADVGVPVGVMVAPVIPGLNDIELPAVLSEARSAGARVAGFVMLRLPLTVEPVFVEWLNRTHPLQAAKVLQRIRQVRGGKMNDPNFRDRMTGTGEMADQIRRLFKITASKLGFEKQFPPHNCDLFRPPLDPSGQLRLF
jgi:DNA repair photolyase